MSIRRMCDFFTTILVAGVLYSGCLTPAAAQNPTCPTRPLGDNTNACASTAFVQNAVVPCTALGAFPVGTGIGSQCSTVAGSVATLNGGPFTINATPNTATSALNTNQSTPTSGTTASAFTFNTIAINDQYSSTLVGTTYGLQNNLFVGLRVNYDTGGTNLSADAQKVGILGHMRRTIGPNASGSDALGTAGAAYSNVNYTGVSGLVGVNASTLVDNGGTEFYTPGLESDVAILTGGTASHRTGLNLRNWGNQQATVSDSAILVTSQLAGGEFKNFVLLSDLNTQIPLSTTANLFNATAAFTIANVLNFSTMTVTGNILSFPNALLTGSGNFLRLGGGTFDVSSGGVQTSIASGGRAEIFSSTNTTTGTNAFLGFTSLFTNSAVVGAAEPNNTATVFGQTLGNWVDVISNGAANNGMLLGTLTNVPLLIGTNNTERARVLLGLMVGTATDPGIGIVNVLTGFRIGNAATSGNVLRGNGTNFVSAQLACSDLSGVGSGCSATVGAVLSYGTHLTNSAGASSYNGTAASTIATDATSANTASTIVSRDGSGNFTAGTITASLTGHASLDCALTGCTMAGAIAMGGNNITGGGTAAFTSLTASTSVTSPLHIGGSGTTGTQLTFQTTTGVGTTDAFVWKRGNNGATTAMTLNNVGLVVGSTANNTGILLTVSGNAATLQAAPTSAISQFAAADATPSIINIDSYGTGAATAYSSIAFRRANGTAASPSALQSGDIIAIFGGFGRGTTGYSAGNMAQLRMLTSETWSDTAQGEEIEFYITPNTTVSVTRAGKFFNSGGFGVGTTTDPGIGSLQLNAQIFMPNITTSSAATTGTVCWTTGTGKFTADTTVGCLTSIMAAKNITERLTPSKALDIITHLDPFAFRYKKGYGDSGQYEQFGLGAEEVALIDERLAGRDPEGALQGVRYQEMTAVLAGAIQQLKADNDNLRTEFNQRKAR